jgi:hypothetical protein
MGAYSSRAQLTEAQTLGLKIMKIVGSVFAASVCTTAYTIYHSNTHMRSLSYISRLFRALLTFLRTKILQPISSVNIWISPPPPPPFYPHSDSIRASDD